MTEVELKCRVPAAALAAVKAAMSTERVPARRMLLKASYYDTAGLALAQAGLVWRLRREGRRWVQTLKAAGAHALERFEHEVIRPTASLDETAHAGTPAGDLLAAVLRRARAGDEVLQEQFRTEVRRLTRRLRSGGAVIEIALDEGRVVAGERSAAVRELEFELVTGPASALVEVARRWSRRFGLWIDPHNKSELGRRLAAELPFPPLRKSRLPDYGRTDEASAAFGVVLDECLAQVLRNAAGLIDGDPGQRVEHVHQMRVGLRRLRSAWRCFRGWVPPPPQGLFEGLKGVFAELGRTRDADVLDAGVLRELEAAGAPSLAGPEPVPAADPSVMLLLPATQSLWWQALAWRVGLLAAGASGGQATDSRAEATSLAAPSAPDAAAAPGHRERYGRRAAGRLARWHERLAVDARAFDDFDEPAVHELRKRIKRQRYATEFFAPALRRAQRADYLQALGEVQERLGELNDLFVARARYQDAAQRDPGAWFALGWLAARIAERRAVVSPALQLLARTPPPRARHRQG